MKKATGQLDLVNKTFFTNARADQRSESVIRAPTNDTQNKFSVGGTDYNVRTSITDSEIVTKRGYEERLKGGVALIATGPRPIRRRKNIFIDYAFSSPQTLLDR